ncbi:MAG: small multi-drug export protein [bacterium]|nr:small multi-drug export protein [bacterium]
MTIFSPEITTLLLGMVPLIELRGAIPYGMTVLGLEAHIAFFYALLGNVLVVLSIPFLGAVSSYLSKRWYAWNRLFAWVFERTRKNHHRAFLTYRDLALVLIVAIPLPLTGAWAASVASFLFGIPFTRALPLITMGLCIAGFIMILIVGGFSRIMGV